jgi:hypothetical protein
MIVRVRVPTVEQVGQPSEVELSFDEDAWHLRASDAQMASGWMRAAASVLGSAGAGQVAEAIERACRLLREEPPRQMQDHVLGVARGQLSSGEPAWLEIDVESGVRDPSHPRIKIHTADAPDLLGAQDTWWLDGAEGRRTASLLREAASAGAGAELGSVGAMPAVPAFLHVGTALDPEHERTAGVTLRFDDELVAEAGDDGLFWLAPATAHKLAGWLDDAVAWAAAHPPHVWQPPEPDPRLVAEIQL